MQSWPSWTLGLVGLLGAACVAPPTIPNIAEHVDWVKSDANMYALSMRVDGFYELFQASISRAADEASAASTSADERRELLLWKSQATSLALAATFRTDTLVAVLDLWTLCVQLRDALEDDSCDVRLGAGAEPVRLTMDRLIDEIETIAATVLVDDDLEPVASMVEEARQQNPIEGQLNTRVSGISEHADSAVSEYALSDAVGSMGARVHDIALLLTIMMTKLPQMIRWETELFLGEDLQSLSESVERLASVAEQVPAIVERERSELTRVIRDERMALMNSTDEQRVETLETLREERLAFAEFLQGERIAVLENIDQQRRETVAALGVERVALVGQFGDERREMIKEMEESLTAAPAAVRQIVDHFFLRVVQIGAIFLALMAVFYLGRRTLVRG